jgi:hypothetical protein
MERNLKVDTVMVKDALYNLHPNSGSSKEYAKAILVGVMSGLVASGIEFDTAWRICKNCFPEKVMPNVFPESWEEHS